MVIQLIFDCFVEYFNAATNYANEANKLLLNYEKRITTELLLLTVFLQQPWAELLHQFQCFLHGFLF